MNLYNGISFLGCIVLIFLAALFSTNRRKINGRVVLWGMGLQFFFAWFLFVFPAGVKFFLFLNDVVVKIMDSALAGARFVFGALALAPGMTSATGEKSLGFILAFQAFPSIIFFSSLMAILYYGNVMPRLVKAFAYLFTKLMRVSGAESLCAASNIFVGVESALTIKPFLKEMTRSELCTVLTAGMATVSSNVMAVYVFSLQQTFPNIAGHLISASFLSAPAALMMSKLFIPETESPKTLGTHVEPYVVREGSLFEAIVNGANTGVRLIVGITALLVAVLGLVALVDQAIGFLGNHLNAFLPMEFDWSLKGILGVLFYPLTLILGIPPSEAVVLARIIGERMVVTEVVAYQDLASAVAEGTVTDLRAAVITTYALCGFAHVASLAIFIGGISAIVPERTRALAEVGFRALGAATFACLLTACVAGVFFVKGSLLLGK